MFLEVDAVAIVACAVSVITAIIVPLYSKWKKRLKQEIECKNRLNSISKGIDTLSEKMDSIENNIADLQNQQNELRECQNNFDDRFDKFEVQQLKYMINDAFFSYDNIREIPDEILIQASQCCEIYTNKGLNHETGAKCKLIFAEVQRRQALRANGGKEEDNNE